MQQRLKGPRDYPEETRLKRIAYTREWQHRNPERIKLYRENHRSKERVTQKERRERYKLDAFNAYGGPKCACCGEEHIEFLSIDHTNGGGSIHRREIGRGHLYEWLKKSGYPQGFRVLCMNCNFARGHHGYCPHEREHVSELS